MGQLRLASYNVHRGIGRDRKFVPDRILGVINEIAPDVIALQEVEAHDSGGDMLAWLAEHTGFHAVAGTTLVRHDGHYGNGLLTRCPVISTQLIDLSVNRCEPRGAIAADLDCTGKTLRVVATHLGLRPSERRQQVKRLLPLFSDRPHDRAVLVGDLNEWFLWGRPLRWLHKHFARTPALPTFPSRKPVLSLDRLWAHPGTILKRLEVHKTPLARVASDHLPLVATLEL
jgi:endonuclease/exonuclease/phosphatase family metal-dependent hydrolase